MQIWPVLTEISQKVLPESTDFFYWYPALFLFWSHVILRRAQYIDKLKALKRDSIYNIDILFKKKGFQAFIYIY